MSPKCNPHLLTAEERAPLNSLGSFHWTVKARRTLRVPVFCLAGQEVVAQAVREILPDGDKEKQLMQGLLNQRDQLEKAEAPLF
jgi:hypothetical protein